jgi:ATP-binding cassette subfamily F protein 3
MTPALEIYHGNYSAYLRQRAERYQRRLEEYQTQAEFVEKEEDYIRRNIAGQNTRQAQGRRKRLERMLEEARITPPSEGRRLHLHLQPVARSGDLVLRTNQLSVGYADEGRPLFKAPDLILTRGECAAIIGPNGAGKTTFLKTLLEQIPAYSGECILGANLSIGYFAQAHEGLNPRNNLVDEIQAIAPQMRPGEVRDYLARFLFTGDDAFKEVSVLSGGERGRLALAKLALSGANLLLLDEPTNHLDLPAQEVLQSVLSDYAGTILLVSHDRYLIDALATQIWEVDPLQSELRIFDGTYSEFKQARETEAGTSASARTATSGKPAQAVANHETDAGTAHGPSRPSTASNNNERRRLQRIKSLEDEISTLESKLAGLTSQLENPPSDAARVTRLGQDYQQMQQLLEERLEEWANLSE